MSRSPELNAYIHSMCEALRPLIAAAAVQSVAIVVLSKVCA